MRTASEFEPLGLWMGWEKHGDHHGEYWAKKIKPGFWDWCKDIEETSLTDSEAWEALNRLVEKGYAAFLSAHGKEGYSLSIAKETGDSVRVICNGEDYHPTISAAVEEALLKLIAAEGGKE